MRPMKWLVTLVIMLGCGALAQANAADKPWRVVPHGLIGLQVMQGEDILLEMNTFVVGPEGAAPPMRELPRVVAPGRRVFAETLRAWTAAKGKAKPADLPPVDFRYEVSAPTADSIVLQYRCAAKAEVKLTGVSLTMPYGALMAKGRIRVQLTNGEKRQFELPLSEPEARGLQAAGVAFASATGQEVAFQFDNPLTVDVQREQLSIWPVSDDLKADQPVEQKVTVRFDRPVALEPQNRLVDMADWYPVAVESDHRPGSAIGMEDWLDRPAGRHGWAQTAGDSFAFKDGTPVKFWGINICVGQVAPPREIADQWADRCAKYGANLVRMHKFWSHAVGFGQYSAGISDDKDSLKFNEEAACRWDYFNAALTKRGVYTGWSPYYAFRLTPADRDRVLGYDEIMKATVGPFWYHCSTIGLVNFAPDLQDLHIQAMVRKLNRVNTVTNRRYAEEPSLAYIEIQNEDCIFFGNVAELVAACPTYARYLDGEFSDWLKRRHVTRAALRTAWGEDLKADEDFPARNIQTFWKGYRFNAASPRTLETQRFLFERQDTYYRRLVEAIRATGYQGLICGSNWFASTTQGFYYNLVSDQRIGFVDRHMYAKTQPMLRQPGSGLLNAGRLVVADRPFGLSEWGGTSLVGSGDGTAQVGVYGMGLQDWDLSGQFASSTPLIERLDGTVPRLGSCDQIVHIAQYPALARMIYRGDVAPGAPVLSRRLSLTALDKGETGFKDDWEANQVSFAAGRVRLEVIDGPVSEPLWQNIAPYVDEQTRRVRSTTGQLEWDYSDRGFFTVNTPGTQGVIGFGGGRTHRLAQATIEQQSAYGLIYVSSRQRDRALKDADAILIHTVGRALNEGTVVDDQQGRSAMVAGAGRLLMEPVKAVFALSRAGPVRVRALDHDGRLPQPAVEIPVEMTAEGARFTLDGAKHKTMYYLVEFAR